MSSAGVQSWTLTPSDNTTINGINIAESCPAANINNSIRQLMSSALQEIAYRGADISASVSMSLAGIDYRLANVTGSASIIHVGNGRAGLVRNLVWHSPSTLVNSSNILCDGEANIVTVTNDITVFTSFGSGVWRAVHFPVSAQTVNTNNIADNAVTFAKMQAITDGHLLGASGGTAIEEISVGSGLQLSSNVLSAIGGSIPPGGMLPYGASSAPSGWLLCDGSAVSRATYAALFAVIGTTYGVGDNSTTFNVPDLRGRIPVGLDNMGGSAANRITAAGCGITGTTMGAAGGEETHTLITAEIPAHGHSFSLKATGASGTTVATGSGTAAGSFTTDNTGGGGDHNNVQPTLITTWVIKT